MECFSPPLPKHTLFNDTLLNYTVLMDGASGPLYTDFDLQIGVLPDPVFTQLHQDDQTYILGSKTTIRIMVRGLYVL